MGGVFAVSGFPQMRLRRLRRSAELRQLTALPPPGPQRFLWPVFVVDGHNRREPIAALPGQFRVSVDRLEQLVADVAAQGIGGVLLFGVCQPQHKSSSAAYAHCPDAPVAQAVRLLRQQLPQLLVFTDVCVCAYTDHGHCGIVNAAGELDNDLTLPLLAEMALTHAEAGAHAVAPSAMIDGQVQAIRQRLDATGHNETILMSYSTKFASAMYGPFRDAAGSAPGNGDRRGYQADAADPRLALRESLLDQDEGADILMVKPALFYLDILWQLRQQSRLPLAAYNVSGEYAMLHASAEHGGGDLDAMVRESLGAIARAGADIIISYWACFYTRIFGKD